MSGSTEINVNYNGMKKYSRTGLGINGLSSINNNGFIYFDNKDTNGINAIRILRTDSMFNEISQSWIYKSDRLLFGSKMIKDKNCYIIGGENISFQGDEDAYIVKIDTSGNLVWDKIIPPRFEFNERIISINHCSDSGFIAIGLASSFSGSSDFLAIKTDKDGNTTPVSISNFSSTVPLDYVLYQNYPNPFNPVTTINYEIPKAGFISLKVFDITGKEVADLINEFKSAGSYSVTFNAASLSSGVYFYRIAVHPHSGAFASDKLVSNNFTAVKRMVVVK